MSLLDAFRALCGLWLVAEIVLGWRTPGRPEDGRDKSSLLTLWSALIVAIAAGLLVAKTHAGTLHYPLTCQSIGIALLLTGMSIRFASILTLRGFFTVHVTILPDHRLIQTGLYARVRHPAYLGALLGFMGIAVAMNNWLAGLTVLAPVLAAFVYRMRVEEAALRSRFGSEYEAYAARTNRLVPRIY